MSDNVSLDVSNYGGVPVKLYDFMRQSTPTHTGLQVTTHWRFTSADRDITLDGVTFTAAPISDQGMTQSGDTLTDQVTITVAADSIIPSFFVGSPPSDPIKVAIMTWNYNDGDPSTFISWAGSISGISRQDELSTNVLCNTLSESFARNGLRLAWVRMCPHALYDFDCTVNPLDFERIGVCSALDDAHIDSDVFATVPDGWASGGFVEWLDTYGHAERRGVISHGSIPGGGSQIQIMGSSYGLSVGQTLYLYAGCDRTGPTCVSKFNNLANYGGFEFLPGTSPFSGDPVF